MDLSFNEKDQEGSDDGFFKDLLGTPMTEEVEKKSDLGPQGVVDPPPPIQGEGETMMEVETKGVEEEVQILNPDDSASIKSESSIMEYSGLDDSGLIDGDEDEDEDAGPYIDVEDCDSDDYKVGEAAGTVEINSSDEDENDQGSGDENSSDTVEIDGALLKKSSTPDQGDVSDPMSDAQSKDEEEEDDESPGKKRKIELIEVQEVDNKKKTNNPFMLKRAEDIPTPAEKGQSIVVKVNPFTRHPEESFGIQMTKLDREQQKILFRNPFSFPPAEQLDIERSNSNQEKLDPFIERVLATPATFEDPSFLPPSQQNPLNITQGKLNAEKAVVSQVKSNPFMKKAPAASGKAEGSSVVVPKHQPKTNLDYTTDSPTENKVAWKAWKDTQSVLKEKTQTQTSIQEIAMKKRVPLASAVPLTATELFAHRAKRFGVLSEEDRKRTLISNRTIGKNLKKWDRPAASEDEFTLVAYDEETLAKRRNRFGTSKEDLKIYSADDEAKLKKELLVKDKDKDAWSWSSGDGTVLGQFDKNTVVVNDEITKKRKERFAAK